MSIPPAGDSEHPPNPDKSEPRALGARPGGTASHTVRRPGRHIRPRSGQEQERPPRPCSPPDGAARFPGHECYGRAHDRCPMKEGGGPEESSVELTYRRRSAQEVRSGLAPAAGIRLAGRDGCRTTGLRPGAPAAARVRHSTKERRRAMALLVHENSPKPAGKPADLL